ncbi:hypothetical protein F4814DRAFT_449468 [Daldinia grandis]|nr:hypothetical protein F4814DRAFT_449468 [Daldinia grandis]
MAKKSRKAIPYAESFRLISYIDNQGWSTLGRSIKAREFQGRRDHSPKPLVIEHDVELKEMNFPRRFTKIRLSLSGFDSGLGCFANPSKLVETGRGELDGLYRANLCEIKAAMELIEGSKVWEDEDWIDFQRGFQKFKEPKTEGDLIAFHETRSDREGELSEFTFRPCFPEANEFLTGLDDMESALSGVGFDSKTIPAFIKDEDRENVRQHGGFEDWIEEADFVEANASVPAGTWYYSISTISSHTMEEDIWGNLTHGLDSTGLAEVKFNIG